MLYGDPCLPSKNYIYNLNENTTQVAMHHVLRPRHCLSSAVYSLTQSQRFATGNHLVVIISRRHVWTSQAIVYDNPICPEQMIVSSAWQRLWPKA